jgi:hypothetical protein
MAAMAMATLSATVAMALRAGTAQMAAATAAATAGVAAKMVAATAETAAMTVVGREGMALTAAKAAATATIDCTGGRDDINSRKSRNCSSACTDGNEGFLR